MQYHLNYVNYRYTGILYSHDEFGGCNGRARYAGRDIIDEETGSSQGGLDCQGHGTHVAGLAGGETYGVAKDAILYSVRVLGCSGYGSNSGVIYGILYAAEQILETNRPGIISMSLGGGYSQTEIDVVEEVVSYGVHVIVAAGNSNDDACYYAPAAAPSAITVGATDINDTRAYFSNYGTCVDIFAPGLGITSADFSCDSCVVSFSGTSMACPITSGVAATLLEANNYLTPAELAQQLIDSSTMDVISDPGSGSPNRLLYGVGNELKCEWY